MHCYIYNDGGLSAPARLLLTCLDDRTKDILVGRSADDAEAFYLQLSPNEIATLSVEGGLATMDFTIGCSPSTQGPGAPPRLTQHFTLRVGSEPLLPWYNEHTTSPSNEDRFNSTPVSVEVERNLQTICASPSGIRGAGSEAYQQGVRAFVEGSFEGVNDIGFARSTNHRVETSAGSEKLAIAYSGQGVLAAARGVILMPDITLYSDGDLKYGCVALHDNTFRHDGSSPLTSEANDRLDFLIEHYNLTTAPIDLHGEDLVTVIDQGLKTWFSKIQNDGELSRLIFGNAQSIPDDSHGPDGGGSHRSTGAAPQLAY